jgi:hypothetical protein
MHTRAQALATWATRHDGPTNAAELVEGLIERTAAAGEGAIRPQRAV